MRIINTAPIRPVEAVKPIKPVREINDFIDFKYKLERNEFNKLLFLENQKLKIIEHPSKVNNNEHLSCNKISPEKKLMNNKLKAINSDTDKLSANRSAAYSKLMFEAEARRLMHEFNYKTKYENIVSILNKCHKYLVDCASVTLLINASYLISPTAVLALLNCKDEDV